MQKMYNHFFWLLFSSLCCCIRFQSRLVFPCNVAQKSVDKNVFILAKSERIRSSPSLMSKMMSESEVWFTWLLRTAFIGAIITAIPIGGLIFKEKMAVLVVITATLIIRDGSTVTASSIEKAGAEVGAGIANAGAGIGTGIGVAGLCFLLAAIYTKERFLNF